jgi:hypothetical protein
LVYFATDGAICQADQAEAQSRAEPERNHNNLWNLVSPEKPDSLNFSASYAFYALQTAAQRA